MKIAYLINQYPKTSHAFIRREILALESCGVQVQRHSIRSTREELADPQDRAELGLTRTLIGIGAGQKIMSAIRMMGAAVMMMLTRPARVWKGLCAAVRLARGGHRSLAVHMVYLGEACLLCRRLEREGAEHLHVHFGTNSAAVGMLCRELGGPRFSMTVHGPDEFDAATVLGLDRKARSASAVIGISAYSKSQLARWLDRSDCGKLEVVHCGLDDGFLKGPVTPVPLERRLVFVGRLTATKGVFVLLEAMRKLGAAGEEVKLVMLGDGPERAGVEEKIREYGLGNQVELWGWASGAQIKAEILKSRALVLPSFAEGLPVVLMEALALCRPVISTWVAGIPELIENTKEGWLTAPGDIEGLTHAMQTALAADPLQLEQMGARGREKVLRNHSARTEAEKLVGIFRRAMEVK